MIIRLIKSNEYAVAANSTTGLQDVVNRPLIDVFIASGLNINDDFDGFAKRVHTHKLSEIFGSSVDSAITFKENITVEKQIISSLADGTPPLQVVSTTEVTNLNAEMVGGKKLADLAQKATTLAGYGIEDAYTKTETDTAIAAAGGGGVGTLPFPDAPPESPSIYDDEFNSSILNAKWAVTTDLTAPNSYDVNTSVPSWLVTKNSSSVGAILAITQDASIPASTAFSCTAQISNAGQVQYESVYMYAMDNVVETNYIRFGLQYNSTIGGLGTQWGKMVAGAATNDITPIVWGKAKAYIHMQRTVGNVWSAFVSDDCVTWFKLTTDITLGFNINKLQLRLSGTASGSTKNRKGINWFRVNWLTL